MGITFTTADIVPDVISFDIPKNMTVPPLSSKRIYSSSPTSQWCQRKSLGIMESLGRVFWESGINLHKISLKSS